MAFSRSSISRWRAAAALAQTTRCTGSCRDGSRASPVVGARGNRPRELYVERAHARRVLGGVIRGVERRQASHHALPLTQLVNRHRREVQLVIRPKRNGDSKSKATPPAHHGHTIKWWHLGVVISTSAAWTAHLGGRFG